MGELDADTIEPWFLFAVIWSFGASADAAGRKSFEKRLLEMIEAAGSKAGPKIKEGECIYDYKYDTAAKTWKNWPVRHYHYHDLGLFFQVSLPNSNEPFCMLNRQRELTLPRAHCGSHCHPARRIF